MLSTKPAVFYPSGDGQPVAESYAHFWAIMTIAMVLRQYIEAQPTPEPKPRYQEKPGTVLANQFLYFAAGYPRLRIAPDVMVIFEVAGGGRDNYKIWEEGHVPAVVFEVTSPGTQRQDQYVKYELYEQMGVQEYWLFDPKGEWIPEQLRGYQLVGESYQLIADTISQQLGLRLTVTESLIDFYRLSDGQKLLNAAELLIQVEQERQQTQQERQRADTQKQKTEQEYQRAELEKKNTEQERQRADRLAQRLRELGVELE